MIAETSPTLTLTGFIYLPPFAKQPFPCMHLMSTDLAYCQSTSPDCNGRFQFEQLKDCVAYRLYITDVNCCQSLPLPIDLSTACKDACYFGEIWLSPYHKTPACSIYYAFTSTTTAKLLTGTIQDKLLETPIENSLVHLYETKKDGTMLHLQTTYTDSNGHFIFNPLSISSYQLLVEAPNYHSTTHTFSIASTDHIHTLPIHLDRIDKGLGTVYGKISEASGATIATAIVVLYQVTHTEGKEVLTPFAFTHTNAQGMYLFSNVPLGAYKIKANKTT